MNKASKVLVGLLVVAAGLGGAALALDAVLAVGPAGARLERMRGSAHYRDGVFVNLEPEAAFRFNWKDTKEQLFGEQQRKPRGVVPVRPLDPASLRQAPAPGLRATWLGHATVLIEIDGKRILTDPMLSPRASPFDFVGPMRTHAAPIALAALAGIDAVVISHNHYDHFDEATIRHLAAQGTVIVVPLGNGAYLERWGVPPAQIVELDWWQSHRLGALEIVATPARHYSNRSLFDMQALLWASWVIVGPQHRLFYSGDSGYAKAFGAIGRRFGPFDIAVVKIGSYGPGDFWHDIHMTPEESVQVSLEVGGRTMLPVHWLTFDLAIHAWDEPVRRALDAARARGVELATPQVGEAVVAGQPVPSTRWWEGVH